MQRNSVMGFTFRGQGQARNLFRLFTPEQKARLFQNIAAAMAGVPESIVQRQLAHFNKADPAYGAGVVKALGLR